MLNVYLWLRANGLPASALDDDRFVAVLRSEVPDASLGSCGDDLQFVVSQFALTDTRAVRRQMKRIALALAQAGRSDALLTFDDVVREDVLDDLRVVGGTLRWHMDDAAGTVAESILGWLRGRRDA